MNLLIIINDENEVFSHEFIESDEVAKYKHKKCKSHGWNAILINYADYIRNAFNKKRRKDLVI